ncbi:MAG: hypothetical protein ACLP0B_19125 [Steroidobacteraceae bacterium]
MSRHFPFRRLSRAEFGHFAGVSQGCGWIEASLSLPTAQAMSMPNKDGMAFAPSIGTLYIRYEYPYIAAGNDPMTWGQIANRICQKSLIPTSEKPIDYDGRVDRQLAV